VQYNAKEGTVKLAYEAQPRPRAIAALSAKTITKVACGNNHTGQWAKLNKRWTSFVFCCFYFLTHLIGFFFSKLEINGNKYYEFMRIHVLANIGHYIVWYACSCSGLQWICLHVCSMSLLSCLSRHINKFLVVVFTMFLFRNSCTLRFSMILGDFILVDFICYQWVICIVQSRCWGSLNL